MISYFSARGHSFSRNAHLQKRLYLFKHCIKELLPERKDSKIIDLGCGIGDFIAYCISNDYTNLIGIDNCNDSINYGKMNGISSLTCCDIRQWIDENDGFEFVMMSHVLEHFSAPDGIDLLKKLYDKMKVGGKLIIFVPNAGSMMGIRGALGDLTHKIYFTDQSLEQILNISGFKNCRITDTPPRMVGIKGVANAMLWPVLRFIHMGFLGFQAGNSIVGPELFAVARR